MEPVAGLAAQLLYFEPPHLQETLWEGLAEGWFERFNIVSLMAKEKNIY